MKIGYYLHLNYGPDSGVYKKILSQIDLWVASGHRVCIYLGSNNVGSIEALRAQYPSSEMQHLSYPSNKRIFGILGRFWALHKLCQLITRGDCDVIYTRQDLFYPGFISLLKRKKVVLEINTNYLAEVRLDGRLKYLYHLFTRPFVLRHVAGAVFMTRELAQLRTFARVSSKAVVSNGYPLPELSNARQKADAEHTTLCFLGSPNMPWHGVDKLYPLAIANPSWSFLIAGIPKGELPPGPPSNMQFLGHLTKPNYLPLILRSTVGIGTLALHRKGMNEACSLKVREYLAYGLPVIIGYNDTDFPVAQSYICQLPNNERNVCDNLDIIAAFVATWRGRKVPRDSVVHIDAKQKEQQRLAFLETVIKR